MKNPFKQFQQSKSSLKSKNNLNSNLLINQPSQLQFQSSQIQLIDQPKNNLNKFPQKINNKQNQLKNTKRSSLDKINYQNKFNKKPSLTIGMGQTMASIKDTNGNNYYKRHKQIRKRNSSINQSNKDVQQQQKNIKKLSRFSSMNKNSSIKSIQKPTRHPFYSTLNGLGTSNTAQLSHTYIPSARQSLSTNFYPTNFHKKISLKFANNLTHLTFKYNGAYTSTLYNYQLKIKNQTHTKVFIKIKSNNPKHYQVRPVSVQLDYKQICAFTIQLKLNINDINVTQSGIKSNLNYNKNNTNTTTNFLKHDLSRYQNDKFKICYYSQDKLSHTLQSEYESGYTIFPIVVEQADQIKSNKQIHQSKQSKFNVFSYKNMKQNDALMLQEKQIIVYKQLTEENAKKLSNIDQKIRKCEEKDKQLVLKYFNQWLYIAVAIIGVTLGYWVG